MGFSLLLGAAAMPLATLTSPDSSAPNQAAGNDGTEPPSTRSVTLTAYNAVPGQTDDSPLETASGAYSNPEVIAARSQDLARELPFGTIIELDGSAAADDPSCGYGVVEHKIGYRVIEDSMNQKFTNRLDVLLDTSRDYVNAEGRKLNAAQVLGVCHGVTYRVVGHVDVNHIPETQEALVALVDGKSSSLAINQ